MLVEKKTIISYLDIIHKNPELVKNSLANRAMELLEIIQVRLEKRGIKEVSESLYSALFELRLEFIKSLSVEEYEETVREPIVDVSDELILLTSNYQQIILSFLNEFPGFTKDAFSQIDSIHISYHTLSFLENYINKIAPQFIYIKKLVDESLNIDLGLVAIQSSLDGDLKFPKERIMDEFLPFVATSINNFGKDAILSGLWNPTTEQLDNPFFNKLKLQASIEQINQGNTSPVSIDELKQMATI